MSNIKDEDIKNFINDLCIETYIRTCENNLLEALKIKQMTFPSERSDREWLEFTEWVIKRNENK